VNAKSLIYMFFYVYSIHLTPFCTNSWIILFLYRLPYKSP